MSDVSITTTSMEPTATTTEETTGAPPEFQPKRLRYQIEAGAMTQAPYWSNKKDRSNWAASIARDPMSPSGIFRRFWRVAWSAEHFYMVDGQVGEPVEFGCNSKKNGYTQEIFRMFGVIAAITPEHIEIDQYPTAIKAIKAATTPVTVSQRINHRDDVLHDESDYASHRRFGNQRSHRG